MLACPAPLSPPPSYSSPRKLHFTQTDNTEEQLLASSINIQERRNAVARIYVPGSARAKVILQKPAQLKNIPPSVRQQQCREMRRQTQIRKIMLLKSIDREKPPPPAKHTIGEDEVQYQLQSVVAAQRTARHVARIWVTRAKDRAIRRLVRQRRETAARYAIETAAVHKIQWAYRCHLFRVRSLLLLRLYAIVQDAKSQAEIQEEQEYRRRISQRRTAEERMADELQQMYFSVVPEECSEVPPLTVQEFQCATLEPFCNSLISRIKSNIERAPVK